MTYTLKGYHVAMIFGGAFSVIIGVNLVLATQAVLTFPGLEVKNSYVASQSFDADRAAQEALGWEVSARVDHDRLVLRIDGAGGPVMPRIEQATLGRATHVGEDQRPAFRHDGRQFVADVGPLPGGNWNLRLLAVADDGTEFRQRIVLEVAQ